MRAILLLILLSASLASAQRIPDDPVERARKAKETEQALSSLRAEVDALKKTLADAQREESTAVAEAADAERAVSDHRRELAAFDEQVAGHEAELVRIGEAHARIEDEIDTQRDALAALLRLSYVRGRQASAKVLLDPARGISLARSLGYSRVLQRRRLTQIDEHARSLAELGRLVDAETAAMSQLAIAKQEAVAQEKALAVALEEREAVLATLRESLSQQQTRLTSLNRDERGMLRLLEQLRDIFADLPDSIEGAQPFRSLQGRLPWPVQGDAEDSDQGGLVIPATAGTQVRAVAHGRIAFADWFKGYGLLVIVDHGDGFMSLYGRNDALLKTEGAWVQAGDVIASVGRSGGGDRAALYFELRENGRDIEARRWLSRR